MIESPANRALLAAGLLMTMAVTEAFGQTYGLLHWFDTLTDGTDPTSGPILGSDGDFYGTTRGFSGTGPGGTLFRISAGGSLTVIYRFDESSTVGYRPQAGLVQGSDGLLYGTTRSGGAHGEGMIFKMTTSGVATPLYDLYSSTTTPSLVWAPLLEAPDGNFYGVSTAWDGTYYGKIFRITSSGSLTVLHRFTGGLDGGAPGMSGLALGANGELYGTTGSGGAHGYGTVFRITLAGALTTVYSFDGTHGISPYYGVMLASDGNFYGTTTSPAFPFGGNVFRMTPAGVVTTVYTFSPPSGDDLEATGPLMEAADGNLYGVGPSTVFRLTKAGVRTILHTFQPNNDTANAEGPLVEGAGGALYGLARGTGNYNAAFFRLSSEALPPVARMDDYESINGATVVDTAYGVLFNDAPNGGGAMTAALEVNVSHGTLALGTNGHVSYTPTPGFAGRDSFTYRAVNTNGSGPPAPVYIDVILPPTAVDDAYTVFAGTSTSFGPPGVLSNDLANDPWGAYNPTIVSPAAHGTVSMDAYGGGGFTYTPSSGFLGMDSFSYRVGNRAGQSNIATVTLTVVPRRATPPTNLTVESVVGQVVTVRFNPPTDGTTPTGYVLFGGVVPDVYLASIPTGSAAPIFTFTAPVGSFYIAVHALLPDGFGPTSDRVRLHVGVPVIPSPPVALTALANGSAVALSWKNTYGGGPPADIVLDVTGPVTTSLRLGLAEQFSYATVPPGTYTFRVRAVNAGGSSPPSNPVSVSFPAACSGPPQMPARFLAYRVGSRVSVIWDPPAAGPAPTQYRLTVSGALAASFLSHDRQMGGTVGPGTYGLRVRSENACGSSADTPVQFVTVP